MTLHILFLIVNHQLVQTEVCHSLVSRIHSSCIRSPRFGGNMHSGIPDAGRTLGDGNTDIYQLPKLLLASVIQPWRYLPGPKTREEIHMAVFIPKFLLDSLHTVHNSISRISMAQAWQGYFTPFGLGTLVWKHVLKSVFALLRKQKLCVNSQNFKKHNNRIGKSTHALPSLKRSDDTCILWLNVSYLLSRVQVQHFQENTLLYPVHYITLSVS